MEILLLVISALLMLAGLFAILVPIFPGAPLVWLGLFIYAIGTGFRTIPVPAVIIFFFLMALTLVLDFVVPVLGLKKYKASKWSMLGSFLGLIIGVVTFGIWGVILGPLAGAFLGELIAKRDLKLGFRAALAALLSSIIGTLLKLVIALVTIGYFIWSFFQ